MLTSMIKNNIHIPMETIFDSSFANAEFVTEGYTPSCRYNRNCHGGIAMIDVKSTTCKIDFKRCFVELNFRKKIFVLFL